MRRASLAECKRYLQKDFNMLKTQSRDEDGNDDADWLLQHSVIFSWLIQVQCRKGLVTAEQLIDLVGGSRLQGNIGQILTDLKRNRLCEFYGRDAFALTENMARAVEGFFGDGGNGPNLRLLHSVPYFPEHVTGGTFLELFYLLTPERENAIVDLVYMAFERAFQAKADFVIPFDEFPQIRLVIGPAESWNFLLGVFPHYSFCTTEETDKMIKQWNAVTDRVEGGRNLETLMITTFTEKSNIKENSLLFPQIKWISARSAIRFFYLFRTELQGEEEWAAELFPAFFTPQKSSAISVRLAVENLKNAIVTAHQQEHAREEMLHGVEPQKSPIVLEAVSPIIIQTENNDSIAPISNVLLFKHRNEGDWHFPIFELNHENPHDKIVREVEEITGIRVRVEASLPVESSTEYGNTGYYLCGPLNPLSNEAVGTSGYNSIEWKKFNSARQSLTNSERYVLEQAILWLAKTVVNESEESSNVDYEA